MIYNCKFRNFRTKLYKELNLEFFFNLTINISLTPYLVIQTNLMLKDNDEKVSQQFDYP